MKLIQEQYSRIREQIQTGDIIAFAGHRILSEIVKLGTGSNISHIGIVCITHLEHYGCKTIEIMESVKKAEDSETGQTITGVTRNRLSRRIKHYEGEVYWFPLSHKTRSKLDYTAAIRFLMSVQGLPYDIPQAIQSALDAFEGRLRIFYAMEDYSAFFCSELAAAALKAGGVLPDINASEMSPIELLRQPVFFCHYYQIKGNPGPVEDLDYPF